MDDKAAILNQLRIDRTRSAYQKGPAPWRPWAIGGLGVAILIGLGAVLLSPKGVPVHAAVVKAASAEGGPALGASLLDASGYVVALREAAISGKSIYKVNEVLVEAGQHVRKGQVIALLDDSNVKAALEQSKAQVNQSEAAVAAAKIAADDARPTFLRNQRQLAEGLISQSAFDVSKAGYDAAQNAQMVAQQNLGVAKATVEINQRLHSDTVIRTPFDGVVTMKTAQAGEIVSPQFQGGGGIATIVDMDSLEVQVDVSENFISRVHAGQRATIKLNAYPDWAIPAHVIAVIPTADQTKATVKVRVAFEQKDDRVLPQMGARVSFLEDRPARGQAGAAKPTALVIPPDAVQVNGVVGTVFVIDGDRVERRAVRLGERTADGQIVLSGLQAGLTVAAGDLSKLTDDVRVHVEK